MANSELIEIIARTLFEERYPPLQWGKDSAPSEQERLRGTAERLITTIENFHPQTYRSDACADALIPGTTYYYHPDTIVSARPFHIVYRRIWWNPLTWFRPRGFFVPEEPANG